MVIFNGGFNSWLPTWSSPQVDISEPLAPIRDSSAAIQEPSNTPPSHPLSDSQDAVDPQSHQSTRDPIPEESQEPSLDSHSIQSERVLDKKPSCSSIIPGQANTWLGWVRRESILESATDTGSEILPPVQENASIPEPAESTLESSEVAAEKAHIADTPVERHHNRSSSSGWGFWGTNDALAKQESDLNIIKATAELSNTILNIAPNLLLRLDDSTSDRVVEVTETGNLQPPSKSKTKPAQKNDAVLYRAHDQTTDFNKINTHRNENFRENILVPEWEDCLAHQSRSRLGPLFSYPSTSSRSAIHRRTRSWTHLIRSSIDWSKSWIASSAAPSIIQDEFKHLKSVPHKLYGLRLEILPHEKRACLPEYDKLYTAPHFSPRDNAELLDATTLSKSRIVSAPQKPLRKIKKILIIGVHGFFPHRVMRPLIGPPQGTSSKFASEAEKAVLRYCKENGLLDDGGNNMSIQKIALEREGDIFDRVDFFTNILSRWQLELNSADFIFVASHSQGCVVAIILIARIICLGILQNPTKKRIGILGMAGINNGPIYGADKTFFMKAYLALENASMLELFEFTKFDSKQSLVYKQSVQMAINANVKICFVASVNDPLVPLYSALASHIFHPNIFRACYIDHSSQTLGFIQQMVSNCCYLQNMGYSDDGVLRELSTALAGPLTGDGHSRVYNDGKVYDLGLRFFLDTSDIIIPTEQCSTDLLSENELMMSSIIKDHEVEIKCRDHSKNAEGAPFHFLKPLDIPSTNRIYVNEYDVGKIGTNACLLPWCVRGLLLSIEKHRAPNKRPQYSYKRAITGSEKVNEEILKLQQLYMDWNPRTKALKELKSRLGGMRSSKL